MNCNPYEHIVTSLTTAGVMTVTNPNNVANLDRFILILAVNPWNIITGTPVNYTITINGTAVALKNRFGLEISSDKLLPRKPYVGYYVVPTTGDPYVILTRFPLDKDDAMSSAVTTTTTDETDGD